VVCPFKGDIDFDPGDIECGLIEVPENREDPEGIFAIALDAIMPLEIRDSELYWRIAHWYNRDLEKLQEICQNQPACAKPSNLW